METGFRSRLSVAAAAILVALVFAYSHSSPVPLSYDFGGHLSRLYILVHDGPGWTEMWYNGYPLFHYYPPLYYYLSAPAGMLSFDLVRPFSFGVLGLVSFGSMYHYASLKLSRERAVASGLLFISGWLLYIAHLSGSVPQALAAGLAPAFYAELGKSLDGGSPFPAGFLAAAIVLLHHNAAAVVALGGLIYLAVYKGNVLNAVFSGLAGFALSSFWLVPALWEFGGASYGSFWALSSRGVETVLGAWPLFLVPAVLKLGVSLDSWREHRTEAALLVTGTLLSLGFLSPFLELLPVVSKMPPYRTFLLAAFSGSFLAAASRGKLVFAAAVTATVFSVAALGFHDDAGFRPGQRQAYSHLEQIHADLVYDSDDRDTRAFGLTVHGKDIADGWSVGSTALRPGLEKFRRWQLHRDERAVNFLYNWSVDTVVTYRDNRENTNLHLMLENSTFYSRERCFEKVCVFRNSTPVNDVNRAGDIYRLEEGITPLPYSGHFNGSTYRTRKGFLGSRDSTTAYRGKTVHDAGIALSLGSAIVFILLWSSGFRVPGRYSKLAGQPLHHVRYNRRGEG